ncbi:hypothetical protein NP233_g2533 [Leucocoprinus birnbaumii]|uniref:Uncharacterized protein n=1 Tax=Leucocoprinus birnbaumii TaxID=56174 RepID=A0AAD5W181_9AGAR|nr:hypothetical protein NP233_g2533 [Leucocoprinus birnbaumii]
MRSLSSNGFLACGTRILRSDSARSLKPNVPVSSAMLYWLRVRQLVHLLPHPTYEETPTTVDLFNISRDIEATTFTPVPDRTTDTEKIDEEPKTSLLGSQKLNTILIAALANVIVLAAVLGAVSIESSFPGAPGAESDGSNSTTTDLTPSLRNAQSSTSAVPLASRSVEPLFILLPTASATARAQAGAGGGLGGGNSLSTAPAAAS